MQPALKKRWRIAPRIPEEIDRLFTDYHPVQRQLLYNRNVTDLDAACQFLLPGGSLYDPFLMLNMDLTADRILWAIDREEPIAIYGDYDVDGVTATALMVQVLQRMGANVRAYIPNRFEEGYGLNNEALENLLGDGVRLVITVDCGIRSPREASHAHHLGIDMIISDHHEPAEDLPFARAILCPKQPGDSYPEKNLAGVGLAYKICEALLVRRPTVEIDMQDWLDLVAVGTVADIVPLRGENRALVRAGLRRLRQCRRQGLYSLARLAELKIEEITARDIGFVIGPRLNAAGRLDSALASFELLTTSEVQRAGELAQQLDNQNRERQELTRSMQEQAERIAEEEEDQNLVIAVHPEFNMGVVGLVASKLTDVHYRPSVVGSQGEEYTRASCRSIPEFNITHALDECADLLVRHGGHAMAAGFTIRNEQLPDLSKRLRAIAERELGKRDLYPELKADMEVSLYELQRDMLGCIDAIEPTGLGNPGVLFVTRGLKVSRYKAVGKEGSHLRLTVNEDGLLFDAIAFRQGHWAAGIPPYVDLLYAFETNDYNGRLSFQLNVRDMKASGEPDES
ncbi:MAG TPA: single-stranded-DNA-specific exonuclease RecJ [Levilinea sp.]|nr:single-stranded-DNA-specific exonuclease RecJ [Levilinea sp.]